MKFGDKVSIRTSGTPQRGFVVEVRPDSYTQTRTNPNGSKFSEEIDSSRVIVQLIRPGGPTNLDVPVSDLTLLDRPAPDQAPVAPAASPVAVTAGGVQTPVA